MNHFANALPGKRLMMTRLLVLAVGVIVSAGLYVYSKQLQQQNAIFEMNVVAQQRALEVADRASQLLTMTRSLQTVLQQHPTMTFGEFQTYAQLVLDRYEEVRSVGWAPLITASQVPSVARAATEQRIAWSLHDASANTPVSSQFDGYFLPLLYTTGRGEPLRKPGFDLMSLGLFRDEIRQAWQENRPVISRSFGQVTPEGRKTLSRIFAPVTVNGSVKGMVTLLIESRRFMERIATRNTRHTIPFEIYDETDHNKLPVFHWPVNEPFSSAEAAALPIVSRAPFFDHQWRLVHVPTDTYLRSFENSLPLILFLAGISFTLVLYLLVRHTQLLAERALAEAHTQFWKLEQTHKKLSNRMIERSTFEHAHLELQERLTDFQNLVDGYFWELDPKGRLTFLSRQATKYLGQPIEQMTGKPFIAFLHPDDATELGHLMNRAAAANRTFTMEVRLAGRQGNWRWEMVHGKPLFDDTGCLTGFRGYNRDITLFKQQHAQAERAIAGDQLFYGERAR